MSFPLSHNEGRNEDYKAVVNRDERLLKTGEYADLRVTCGDREWNLHRNILASRCDWFDKALGGNFKGETPLVDICIRLYDVADFFLLPKLQERCLVQFRNYNSRKCATLQNQYWVQDIDNIGDILHDLRAAYSQNTAAADAFRGLLKTFVHETRYRLFRSRPFIELLDELPELAADVLTTMIRSGEFMRLTYPEVCSSCGARKSGEEHHSHTIISSMSRPYTLCRACVGGRAVAPSTED
ncbi:uncharacterized protein PG986_012603 [Apiospora aurea]|uniref:BTB domain-containing protein n=1 Tax=Apiospora aurea TaxID=335848 RepID=A0ABR1Q0P2_9PEZI